MSTAIAGVSTAPKSSVSFLERRFYGICRAFVVNLSRLYYPGGVVHKDRLPKNGAYLLAPVHRSYVDWLIVARVSRRRLRFIVKHEVWKVRAVGRLVELLGAFSVQRDVADREAVNQALSVLAGGEPLVMFPEGTRRSGATVEDLREGAAYVALRAQVPIVPVGLKDLERAMPRGSALPRPVRTRVVVGEPIWPAEFLGGDSTAKRVPRAAIHSMTAALTTAMQATFDEAQTGGGRGE